MKLLKTPYGYYDIATRASYEINSYMDRAADLTEFRVWFVQVEHPECDHEGSRIHTRLTDNFTSRAVAVAELDRIAALISGEAAPAHGWVKGKPPHDGNYYAVLGFDDGPCVVSGHPDNDPDSDYDTPSGSDACRQFITHYLPLPKES